MNSAALVMLLAAAEPSGFWEDSAATGFVRLASKNTGGSVLGGTHLRLGLGYDTQSFFVEGRGSFQLAFDGVNAPFQDLGSSLSFGYRPHGFLEELRLTLWPFNSVTALPVFDWANRIGNTPLEFAPAFSLQASTPVGAVWATTRLRRVLNNASNAYEVRPDLFFGVNTLLPNGFQFDARAAWFQYGLVPSLAQSGIQKTSDGFIASARLSWKWNEFVGPAMDFDFYANDPWRFERFFVPETRVTRAALWLAMEGGGGAQRLVDPDVFSSMKSQALGWADAQLRVRVSDTRFFLTGRIHSLAFATASTPGLPPYVAFANGTTVTPKVEGFAGFDTMWRAARLTPGILVRLTGPGTLTSARFDYGGANPPSGLTGPRTIAVFGQNVFSILPFGAKASPELGVKFSLKWEPLVFLTVAGELNLIQNWNSTYTDDGAGVWRSVPTPLEVRGQLLVQARF